MHHGKIWWNELNTWDADAAVAFYTATMGWTFEALPIEKPNTATYWVAKRDGQTLCGIFSLRSPDFDGVPSHWFTYLAVDDISRGLEEVKAAGGTVRREPITIPGVGTMAVILDPTGAGFGMIEPETAPETA